MARQHKAEKKPNFKSNKTPSGKTNKGKTRKGNKYTTGSKKRGPTDMNMNAVGSFGPCASKCGHCVTCAIAKGDAENARRMNRGSTGLNYSWR